MTKYILAIDQGTSSTRALVFNDTGKAVSQAQCDITQYFPHNGWVEHDAEEIWQKTLSVCRDALEKAKLSARQIKACGITNQRETTVLWHKKTGKPVHRAIVWQDRRTSAACDDLRRAGHAELIRKKTGLLLDAYFSASKIQWLFQHVPEVQQLAGKGELAFGTIDSFLLWRFTGGASHATDITNAARTMLFDIHTQDWDEELLALFAVPAYILPAVKDCNACFGDIDKQYLGAAIPITGMAGDQQAALFGQACFQPGMLKATYGTGAFLLLHTGKKCVLSSSGLLSTVAYRINGNIAYGMEGSIFNAGTSIKWLRDELHLLKTAAESEQVANTVPDTAGVYLVPAFTGLGAPYWDPQARAAISGLTRNSNRAHIVQAALAAVAYQTRDIISCMQQDGCQPILSLRVDGGMTANGWLLQFLADLLQLSIQRLCAAEVTASGVALLAGLGAGIYADCADIAKLWQCHSEDLPHMDSACSDKYYAGWQAAVKQILTDST